MTGNLEQIKADRKKLKDEMQVLKEQIEIISLKLKHLSKRCPHTNKFVHYDYGGGSDVYCPDCETYI